MTLDWKYVLQWNLSPMNLSNPLETSVTLNVNICDKAPKQIIHGFGQDSKTSIELFLVKNLFKTNVPLCWSRYYEFYSTKGDSRPLSRHAASCFLSLLSVAVSMCNVVALAVSISSSFVVIAEEDTCSRDQAYVESGVFCCCR